MLFFKYIFIFLHTYSIFTWCPFANSFSLTLFFSLFHFSSFSFLLILADMTWPPTRFDQRALLAAPRHTAPECACVRACVGRSLNYKNIHYKQQQEAAEVTSLRPFLLVSCLPDPPGPLNRTDEPYLTGNGPEFATCAKQTARTSCPAAAFLQTRAVTHGSGRGGQGVPRCMSLNSAINDLFQPQDA